MLVPDVKHKTTVREIGRKLIKTKKAQNTKPIGAMLAPVPQDTQFDIIECKFKTVRADRIQNSKSRRKKLIMWPLKFTLKFVL